MWRTGLWMGITLVAMLAVMNGAAARAASLSPVSSSACQWKLTASPSPGNDSNELDGVAAQSANDVWAVGNYQTNGVVQTLVEHWNGSAWSVVASPNPSSDDVLTAITRVPGTQDDYWAVGQYFSVLSWQTLILHEEDGKWSQVSSPNLGTNFDNFLTGVTAISENDAWAVGSYFDGSNTITLTEHWNGKAWSVVSSPNPGPFYSNLSAVASVASNDVWAVGDYDNNNGEQTLAEHWDGKSWSAVTSPTPGAGGELNAITHVPGTNQVWATGFYFASNSGQQPSLIEQWNGTQWSVVASPSPGASFDYLKGIAAVGANDIWAVGQYSQGEVPIVALVEHWNGTGWSVVSVPSPDASDVLNGVARIPHTNKLWGVGVGNGTLTEAAC